MEMRRMSRAELQEILAAHKEWLQTKDSADIKGKRANLRYVDLTYTDLKHADLRHADLSGADLRNADLKHADLAYTYLRHTGLYIADLSYANLRNANLEYANLAFTNLSNADLSYANMNNVNFIATDLSGADLSNTCLKGANLRNAALTGAKLTDISYDETTAFFAMACPEEGSFVGYKKAGRHIVKLLVFEDAKRSSATSRKCRCSKAKVLSITKLDGSDAGITSVPSSYDSHFIYKVGEIVEVPDFDENRWEECSTGIHFFITRDEAVRYGCI